MAIHTKGILSNDIGVEDVKEILSELADSTIKETEYQASSYLLEFLYEEEWTKLHVDINLDISQMDFEPNVLFTENKTILSLVHDSSGEQIMRDILEAFGGYLTVDVLQ